jgi:hypothetical protein
MGLEKDERPKGPTMFTGEAIDVRLPDIQERPGGKPQTWRMICFPHWLYKVYVEDTTYEVLGSDLEIGMAFIMDGNFIPIIDINKKQLYHGIERCNVPECKRNDDPTRKRLKFKRGFKENGDQFWDITEISKEPTNTN